jgi:hypothetical protein
MINSFGLFIASGQVDTVKKTVIRASECAIYSCLPTRLALPACTPTFDRNTGFLTFNSAQWVCVMLATCVHSIQKAKPGSGKGKQLALMDNHMKLNVTR